MSLLSVSVSVEVIKAENARQKSGEDKEKQEKTIENPGEAEMRYLI
jgi:hypothetical protein